MPNDAAAEKAGSAEHGDGATLRCHHDSNSPVYIGASHCLRWRNPFRRSSYRSILLAMMRSFSCSPFDLLGARRDSSITPAEGDVRLDGLSVSAKLTNFLNKVERFPEIVESNGPLKAVGPPAVSYWLFAGAPGSTAATPSGLMLKARNVNGSLPGFPHWCTRAYGSKIKEPGSLASVLPSTVLAPVPEMIKYRAAPDRWCGGLEGICAGNETRVRLRS